MKNVCWFTYIWTHELPPLKSVNTLAQCCFDEDQDEERIRKSNTHSHQVRVAFSVTPVEEAEHFLLELFAVFVDALSRLLGHYEGLSLRVPSLNSHLFSDRDINLFRYSRQPT